DWLSTGEEQKLVGAWVADAGELLEDSAGVFFGQREDGVEGAVALVEADAGGGAGRFGAVAGLPAAILDRFDQPAGGGAEDGLGRGADDADEARPDRGAAVVVDEVGDVFEEDQLEGVGEFGRVGAAVLALQGGDDLFERKALLGSRRGGHGGIVTAAARQGLS